MRCPWRDPAGSGGAAGAEVDIIVFIRTIILMIITIIAMITINY